MKRHSYIFVFNCVIKNMIPGSNFYLKLGIFLNGFPKSLLVSNILRNSRGIDVKFIVFL